MNLENLSRKELQALAKEHGIKANLSNAAIVDALNEIFRKPVENMIQPFQTETIVETPEAASEVKVVNPPRKSILHEPEIRLEDSVQSLPEVSKAATGPFHMSKENIATLIEIGSTVQFVVDGEIKEGIIKKVNKITCRVKTIAGEELLVKSNELTVVPASLPEIVNEVEENIGENIEISSKINEQSQEFPAATLTEEEPLPEEIDDCETVTMEIEKTDEEIQQEVDRVLDESMVDFDQMEAEESVEMVHENNENEQDDDDDDDPEEGIEYEEDNDDSFVLPNMDSLIGGDTPKRGSTGTVRDRFSSIMKSPVNRTSFPLRKSLSARKSLRDSGVKKTFSTTPLKHKPTIVPRMNAAQQKRLEALQQRKQAEASSTIQPTKEGLKKKAATLPIAPLAIMKPQEAADTKQSQASSVVKFDIGVDEKPESKTNAKLAARKATPNFKALHKKQFENSKPISSFVERDHSIVRKMDAAFNAAQTGQFSSVNHPKSTSKPLMHGNMIRSASSSTVKPIRPAVVKKPVNLETKVTSFVSQLPDKENNPTATNTFLTTTKLQSSGKVRMNAKEASVVKTTRTKQDIRRQSFTESTQDNRKKTLFQKRAVNV